MKPTTPSDTPPVDRDIAERRLANQLSVAAVQAALVKAAEDGEKGERGRKGQAQVVDWGFGRRLRCVNEVKDGIALRRLVHREGLRYNNKDTRPRADRRHVVRLDAGLVRHSRA